MKLSGIHGQDDAIRALRASIRRNEIAHAYLFAGPANSGKTTAALAFAASLTCTNRDPEGDACGVCASCRRARAGTHPDIRVISPEGDQTKIGQMQEMIKSLNYAPIAAGYSVVIIEQADTLNPHSENAILKILEEPPPYAVLILLSRNPVSLLPTIRSRCRIIRFVRSKTSDIEDMLKQRYGLSTEEARVIAECSQGAIGLAVRMAEDSTILEQRRSVMEIMRRLPTCPSVYVFKAAEMVRKIAETKEGDDRTRIQRLRELLDYMLTWYADLLRLRLGGTEARICNLDLRADLEEQTGIYSTERIQTAIASIMHTQRCLEGNVTAQLALENMFFSLRPE